jgi:transposase
MARTLKLPAHLLVDELERRYRRARDPVVRGHLHIVWLLAAGTPTSEVARVAGYSVTWVREVAGRYREGGPDALGDRRHANPGAAPLLSPEQRARLREALGGPAPDGGLWTGRKVAARMGEILDRPVAAQRGWEWPRRLGFTPQRPRPAETRADPDAQAAFKKGGSPPPSPRWRSGPRTSTGSG